MVYGSRADNRRAPVSSRQPNSVAGYGSGCFGGFRGWSLLAVLIGKLQTGRLNLSTARKFNGGIMVMENVQEVIEISEDDYKRNAVYRPWPEETASKTVVSVDKGWFEVMAARKKQSATN